MSAQELIETEFLIINAAIERPIFVQVGDVKLLEINIGILSPPGTAFK